MAFDRDEALKNAEKHARQGRLDQALAEYERVLEDTPDDTRALTAAADLYARANQPSRAAPLFNRLADQLANQGFLPRAEAFYKRALKSDSGNEHSLDRLAALATRSGILVEARGHLQALAQLRRARGDSRGVSEAMLRLAALDPTDLEGRTRAARAAAESGESAAAVREFRKLAEELAADGRHDDALKTLREAYRWAPDDVSLRERLVALLVERGDEAGLADTVTGALDLMAIARTVAAAGHDDLAERLAAEAGRRPGVDQPVADPALQRLQLDLWLRTGRTELVRAAIQDRLVTGRLTDDEARQLQSELPALGWPIAEALADHAWSEGNAQRAADLLKPFIGAHPGHLLALVKLVEVAVEGGLDAELTAAEDALCVAYLGARQGTQARVLAEDLVARAPSDSRFRDLLRRARELCGVAEPALSLDSSASIATAEVATEAPEQPSPAPSRNPFALGPAAVDIRSILGDDPESGAGDNNDAAPSPEVDLSAVIRELKPHTLAPAGPEKGPRMPDRPDPSNLDDVFRDFRDEVSRQTALDEAEQHYKVALTYRDMNMIDDAVRELELAAKAPRLRFDASALLARLLRDRGEVASAVEWFERAAEAPAPTPEAGRQLLYELAQALEESSETSRALAVYLEIQADAHDYRDVGARIERLARVQSEN